MLVSSELIFKGCLIRHLAVIYFSVWLILLRLPWQEQGLRDLTMLCLPRACVWVLWWHWHQRQESTRIYTCTHTQTCIGTEWKIIRREKLKANIFCPSSESTSVPVGYCATLVGSSSPWCSVTCFHGAGECGCEADEQWPLSGSTAPLPNGTTDWSSSTVFLCWGKSVWGEHWRKQ